MLLGLYQIKFIVHPERETGGEREKREREREKLREKGGQGRRDTAVILVRPRQGSPEPEIMALVGGQAL